MSGPVSPAAPFALISLPRCGSTSLALLLNQHPRLSCLIEPFHPERYDGVFHRQALRVSPRESLRRIWTRWNGIKHVFEPNGWPFLGRPELNSEVAVQQGQRVVVIRRRNLLRRLVSDLICRQTRYWIGTREEFCARLEQTRLLPLDPAKLRGQIRRDRDAMTQLQHAMAERGVPTLEICYEDMFCTADDPATQMQRVNAVLAFLNVPPISLPTFTRQWRERFDGDRHRWASPDVYRRIPGIDGIEAEVGNDETGWIFR
jgi:hypothetical protein